MTRRCLFLFALPVRLLAAAAEIIRGHLLQNAASPAVVTREGKTVTLRGDEPTIAVLRDKRLKDEDFEAVGHYSSSTTFEIDPIHLPALYVYRGGQRLVVTYWCPTCSIRTYSPGLCECCHAETILDPRDPALKDTDPSTN